MPKISITPGDLQQAVERRVAMDIAKQLIYATALEPKDVVISFPGTEQNQPLFNSRDQQDIGPDRAHFSYFDKWSMEVTEEYEESALLTMFTQENDAPLLFHDPKLGIAIRPMYSETKVTISTTFRVNSHKEVQHWRDWLRQRINEACADFMFEANFYIVMPKEIASVLSVLYRLRESNAGYGDHLVDWIKSSTNERLTVLANQIGKQQVLAWSEQQTGILGYFDFDIPSQATKTEKGNIHEMTFDFTFNYYKPIKLVMEYPLVIHNQMIPSTIFSKDEIADYFRVKGIKTDLNSHFDFYRIESGFAPENYEGIRNPYYDEFYPKTHPDGYYGLLTTLICVDGENKVVVGNLKDLEPYKLTEEFLEYLRKYREDITKQGRNPFLITMYEDKELLHESLVTVTEDLDVVMSQPMDLRKTYHLRLSYLLDPSRLDDIARNALLYEPSICIRYLRGLGSEIMDPHQKLKVIGRGTKVTKESFIDYLRILKSTPMFFKHGPEKVRALVNEFSVKSTRR